MPYAQNLLPRDPFPRGLGELAQRASGFGTWVVDMHWGLSPPFITGQNRPYGTPVVQTFYPRSQAPRLTNLQTGPVIAAGTWPDLLQTDSSPVFRTPVRRPGEQQISLPPGAGVAGLAGGYSGMHGYRGYGHIPLGVARPPTEMYERASFGSRGTAGFGEDPSAGELPSSITVLGMSHAVTPEDWQALVANQPQLVNMVYSLYAIYVARLKQMESFTFIMQTFGLTYPDYHQRRAYASNVAFGSPDGERRAANEFNALLKVREDLRAGTTAEQIAALPAGTRQMFEQFVLEGAPSAPSATGFGVLPAFIAAVVATGTIVKWVAGALVVLGVIGTAYGVAQIYRLFTDKPTEELRARAQADAAAAELQTAKAYAANTAALNERMRLARTEAERIAAMQALAVMAEAQANMQKKKADVSSAEGLGFVPIVIGAAALIGLFMALRWAGRGKGGGGGASEPASRALEPASHAGGQRVSVHFGGEGLPGIGYGK